jgi:hypothetical protein
MILPKAFALSAQIIMLVATGGRVPCFGVASSDRSRSEVFQKTGAGGAGLKGWQQFLSGDKGRGHGYRAERYPNNSATARCA